MTKPDLRLVEYVTNADYTEKVLKNHPNNKIGYFHLWRVQQKNYGSDYFIGLVEDLKTGELYQLTAERIRFLTEKEVVDFYTVKK
ncbi:hypothetical protein WFZ85_01265 [Flavobacterium sp. j3]|uniref:Uncharacterized protein n=1 Tax=Flavobacterium aureirubrum TaxID=3133147 RepID=A0ABU9N0G9_9FLAO|nr:hypothetical protein [Flavobacterium sp. HXWNR29]MCU4189796.1 hypothetical protein [Flavobacterium sp. HXWNR29]